MTNDDPASLPSVRSKVGRRPEAEVRRHQGRPTVFVDGEPIPFVGYVYGCPCAEVMPHVFPLGYDVYHLPIDTRVPVPWPGTEASAATAGADSCEGVQAWVEEAVADVLQNAPAAWIMVRFYVWPPAAWKALHEEEYTVTEDGDTCVTPSLASTAYQADAAVYIDRLIRWVESRPWASRVIGYVNLAYEEGCQMPVSSGYLYDHGLAMVQRWRAFLRARYGTETELRTAYGDPGLTFANAQVPRDPLRGPVPAVSQLPYWQDADDNRPLRDYLELCRELWVERFAMFGQAMRQAVDRKVVCLLDALKQSLLGWNHNAFFGNFYDGPAAQRGRPCSQGLAWPEFMAGSGHLRMAALLDDLAGFDGVMTPHDYQARGLGGVYEPEGIADSVVLRGHVFLAEMDTRAVADLFPARDEQEWAAITWRNVATGLARGFTSAFLPVLGDPEWLASPTLQAICRRQVEVMRQALAWPHAPVPGIAMVLDDSAVLETNGSGGFPYEAVMWEQKLGLARCGVPHGVYLFEDLARPDFPPHRVFYFPNLFRVDEERLALLRERVLRDGAVVVWGPGSGISDGKKIDPDAASRLTGFRFDLYPHNYPRRVLLSNFAHPVTRDLDPATVYGSSLPFGPVLLPVDGDGVELGAAWISRGQPYQVGLAIKEVGRGASGSGVAGARGGGDYASVFTAAVQLPAGLWRGLARYAGAHVYLEGNDVLVAAERVVGVHSLKSGPRCLRLPGKARVHDLIADRLVAGSTDRIEFRLEAPATALFGLTPLAGAS